MSAETDRYYYTRRAAEERRLARTASHPNARDSHLRLAREYDERASAEAGGPYEFEEPVQDLRSQRLG